MAHIFVTREIPHDGIELLRKAGHEVVVSPKDGVLSFDELSAALKENPYEAVLTTLNDACTAELMETFPQIRIIANYAVGYDNIDIESAKKHNVMVTNTPDVLTDAVAEHTVALMFALAKRIPEADRFTRAGKYEGWGPMLLLGSHVNGLTLGLVGAGRIGSRVALMAQCMGMHVVYFDIKQNADIEKVGAQFVESLEALLQQSDVVSLHVPLLDSTRHLINKERLSVMKKTAFLINTARGPVVDESALVDALKDGTIRAAALDVFEHEPALSKGLKELENVIVTPHIASATEQARSAMSVMAAQSIIDFFEGKKPQHVVA